MRCKENTLNVRIKLRIRIVVFSMSEQPIPFRQKKSCECRIFLRLFDVDPNAFAVTAKFWGIHALYRGDAIAHVTGVVDP